MFSYGQLPYGPISNEEITEKVLSGYRLPAPDNCPQEVEKLIINCCKETPEHRPTFAQIYDSIVNILKSYTGDGNSNRKFLFYGNQNSNLW